MKYRRVSLLGLLLIGVLGLVLCISGAQVDASSDSSESPKAFVQSFYGWYARVALANNTRPAWDIALRSKRAQFAPELARQLQEDVSAQDACKELIGLDFDPFLNTQDPADYYEAGEVTQSGDQYRVAVYPIQNKIRAEKPDVIAEVAKEGKHYLFVNFIYPDGANLLRILMSPRPACSDPKYMK